MCLALRGTCIKTLQFQRSFNGACDLLCNVFDGSFNCLLFSLQRGLSPTIGASLLPGSKALPRYAWRLSRRNLFQPEPCGHRSQCVAGSCHSKMSYDPCLHSSEFHLEFALQNSFCSSCHLALVLQNLFCDLGSSLGWPCMLSDN